MRAVSRRVLVFWIVSLALAALAGAWFHHVLSPETAEERVRKEAERIKERVRDFTH
jgi:hypothetical protein